MEYFNNSPVNNSLVYLPVYLLWNVNDECINIFLYFCTAISKQHKV